MKSDCALFARLYISCQTRDGDLDEFFKHENQGCPPSLLHLGKLRLPKKKYELTECLEANTTRRTERVDIVWDEYVENSLKATTRSDRGAGVRRRVAANNQLPRNWKEFLRVDENKRELFKFLAESTSSLQADTRMLLHIQDALQQGHKKILLRTVDTDVLVLAVAFLQQVTEGEHLDLWVAFGTGNNFRYIAAHEIATKLGPEVSKALPVFHAFTGFDTVSCFGGRGKKTALEAWKSYPDPFICRCVEHLERFVVLMYDRTSSKTSNLSGVDVRRGRQGRCSCTKAGLCYTALCTCTDDCDNT
ncbi:unnamed protein product [Porites evermanni]|uniref:Uncharacterized protein n=1 Tax=Porites evermanni TaxID=104178 RepID=A0ABN8RRE6_9CNID|nr:unnamed protein product [Porites evermanni]